MCRSIKKLFNSNPAVTNDDIQAASLQFVRKVTGFRKPSKINEKEFNFAVEKISADVSMLLKKLKTR